MKRLMEIHHHPLNGTNEALAVCRRLRSAAKLLSSAARYRQNRATTGTTGIPDDHVKKFLNVMEFVDPMCLLDIKAESCDVESIDIALAHRMARIDTHPDAGQIDAEDVRQTLRAAASLLKDESFRETLVAIQKATKSATNVPSVSLSAPTAESPSSSPLSTPKLVPASGPASPAQTSHRLLSSSALLTPFDRHVLAVLVGCGGWNSTSRSLLVSLADAYQVTPDGLVTVVKGLSDYARAHHQRIGVKEITQGMTTPQTNGHRDGAKSSGSIQTSRSQTVMSSELIEQEPLARKQWDTLTISLLATLILVPVLLTALVFTLRGLREQEPGVKDSVVQGIDTKIPETPTNQVAEGDDPGQALARTPARFTTKPTFLGNGLPVEGADAADACVTLPEDFDEIERRVAVADEPSEAVYRHWDHSIDQFATGWVLLDESTRRASVRSMLEVLIQAADRPSVSDRLLQSLTPMTGKLPEPIDVWRETWKAYLLGRIVSLKNMAPVVTDQARRQLDVTLPGRSLDSINDPTLVARAWLDHAAGQLIEFLEYEPRAYDFWELWLASQRELGTGSAHDLALFATLGDLMRTGVDLAREGPSVNIMGRLIDLIEWRGEKRKTAWSELLDDPNVSARDLWVLTSLLNERNDVAWFSEAFIIPNNANDLMRARMRDKIGQAWPFSGLDLNNVSPVARANALLNESEARPWLELVTRFQNQHHPNDMESKMILLLGFARLNESFSQLFDREAALAGESSELASAILVELNQDNRPGLSGTSGNWRSSQVPSVKPGQPIGPDGVWSSSFREARRNTQLRLDMLSNLASTAGTDLGPVDAETFVREVFRGVPQDIRTQAQGVLLQRFSTGPTVMQALLDQLPDASRNANISEFISTLTGKVLPTPGSQQWTVAARMALLDHALLLRRSGRGAADVLTQELIDTYLNRIVALESGAERLTRPGSPGEAGQWLVETRLRRAGHMMTSAPVPDDLPGLHRQWIARVELVEGPIQLFVAQQIAGLELLAYEVAAQYPSERERVLVILKHAAQKRLQATHVLDQAIENERAMMELNELILIQETRPAPGRDGP
ncbi:MAG: hypothetical protein O7G85_02850 [Planctomycetota bacterium]|nr:hypothetical protein [Planctomycetota bacterium]